MRGLPIRRFAVFLAFAAIPILEIAVLVKLGQWIGVFATILVVLATAVLGIFVLHRQGFKVLNRVLDSINAGKTPVAPAVDGAFLMAAGGLLIAPGVMTDLLGLVLLIPQVRHAVAAWSVRRFLRSGVVRSETFSRAAHNARADQSQSWPGHPTSPQADEGPVIDGEFERIDERTIDARRSPPQTGSPSHRSSTNGASPPDERPTGRP